MSKWGNVDAEGKVLVKVAFRKSYFGGFFGHYGEFSGVINCQYNDFYCIWHILSS